MLCGTQLPVEAVYCLKCGTRIQSVRPPEELPYEDEPTPRKRHRSTLILFVLAVAILLGATIFAYVKEKQRTYAPSSFANTLTTTIPKLIPTPEPTPQWVKGSFQVGPGALALRPGSMHWFPFHVNEDLRNVRLKGRFEAQGGSGNDVQIAITDEDGLVNIQNGHGFRSWYNSQKTTVDSLNVGLPPGKFYLVISNRFSIFSHKSVAMNFRLNYEWLKQP